MTAATAAAALLASTGVWRAQAATPVATADSPTGLYRNGALLPSGRLVHPAGTVTAVGDFPVAVAVSPRGDLAVVSNAGQGEGGRAQGDQTLDVVDLARHQLVQRLSDHDPKADTFFNEGVAFSPDGRHVYVTGGGNDRVYDYSVAGDRLTRRASWASTRRAGVPQGPELADAYGYSRNLAVSPDGARIFVTNEQGGTVAALDTASGAIAWESQLPGTATAGPYPAGIALSPDGAAAYVTEQGLGSVTRLDTATGAPTGTAVVGDHPVAIAVTKDGHFAFVTNDNDDSVSVVDLTGVAPRQVRQLSVHVFAGEANGSSPNAVTVDDARGLVYVANAGDDAVTVLGEDHHARGSGWEPAQLKILGYLPTAWYPTGVAVVPGRGDLVAISAKGYGGVPVTTHDQYDGNDMAGLLNDIPRPTKKDLAKGRDEALRNLFFGARANGRRPANSPVPDPSHAGDSPIKHVVLVVRENRTFDQVLSDLPALGRGDADADPRYLEFGRADAKGRTVTPNAHDIALRFATSDNFYSDGEASVQGHYWTALGVTPDYVEKSWLHYYSNRAHPYDPANPIAYPRCGSIFQQLALAGKRFRNFGELEGLATSQVPSTPAPDASCPVPGGAADAVSVANTDQTAGDNLTLTTIKDTARLAEIEKAYAPLAATNQVPDFSYVVMGNDHTGGGVAGRPTPQAQVATNDLAVGGLVDYLSHTPQWSSTAVFVMEDDSQDGLDHRDGHRNVLLAAGPYIRRGTISHVHTSQASVLHTIELILGLRPLSSYTQTAPVPYDMFSSKPDTAPYAGETPTYPLDATNPSPVYGTPAAAPVDVTQVDRGGPLLEAQLWWSTNPGEPMPALLLHELEATRRINPEALKAWSAGRACACQPVASQLLTPLRAAADRDG